MKGRNIGMLLTVFVIMSLPFVMFTSHIDWENFMPDTTTIMSRLNQSANDGCQPAAVIDGNATVTSSMKPSSSSKHSMLRPPLDDLIEREEDNIPPPSTLLHGKNQQDLENTANLTHWCIIGKDTLKPLFRKATWFNHFPHASEVLLPCWSWFRRHNATDRCGISLITGLTLGKNNASWQYQLVSEAMQCQILYGHPTNELGEHQIVTYRPSYRRIRPRYGHFVYLDHPRDAHALRRHLVPDEIILKEKYNGDGRFRIGVLQRTGSSRVFTNLEELIEGLRKAFPSDVVNWTDLSDRPRLKDQAEWFASQHVIVTAHGAGLANSVFITDETVVLQIHPGHFYWPSMEPLVEQSGGIALSFSMGEMDGVDDPFFEHALLNKNPNMKNKHQFANITVPVDKIIEQVREALYYDVPLKRRQRRLVARSRR